MALPQHQFQQLQQSNQSRNLYTIDDQVYQPPLVNYFNGANFTDQSQHPPYVPPFHVVGFAPNPVNATDGSDGGGGDMQWNYGFEPRRKRLKEQDFLENNSPMSSIDFMQPRSVSTGLGLSLDNGCMASSSDSAILSLIGDDIDQELQRQEVEIDRFLKVQADRLKQAVLDKVQANQLRTISYIERHVLQKLIDKEAEVENINRKNKELEDQMEQLSMEAGAWKQRAEYNENMINVLKLNLEQVNAQNRDMREGFGDSEIDDAASCCNGRAPLDFQLLCKDRNGMKDLRMTCRVCGINQVCMLLLPCKHLCLCKDCEGGISFCPLCRSSKFIGMEVYV